MGGVDHGYFGPGLFGFLADLKAHNDRDWFQANKERYVTEVEAPMLRFIADFGERLRAISKHFVADPRRVGGSMFRIYRDTRFSDDKSPFKLSVAAQFPHRSRAKDVSVPGFYLHLERGMCIGGGGLYHPDADALRKVRQHIVERPKKWQDILRTDISIEGDTLKRPPLSFDANHPFVEDLKRKDFYTMTRFSQREVCSGTFLDVYVDSCKRAAPLVEFLTVALALRW
jgi:uncharacterized protein (TIGR02453 family)